jgi:biotin operon repressor
MDILTIVKKRKAISFLELCNELDQSPQKTEEELKALREQGYNIELNPDKEIILADAIPVQPSIEIDTQDYFGNDWIRFGAIADTHLCSKYARLDVLNALYDVYEREGIRDVYLAGNWIDGEARFNKYDLYCIGIENQISYFLKNFPIRKGVTTHVLSGDKSLSPNLAICWKTLRAKPTQTVIRKDKLSGLKMSWIGLSAGKTP